MFSKKLILSCVIALASVLTMPAAFAHTGCQHAIGFHNTKLIKMTADPLGTGSSLFTWDTNALIKQPAHSGDGLINWIYTTPVRVVAETRATRNAFVLAA